MSSSDGIPPSTSTLEAARAHARSQAGTAGGTGPTVPPTAATDLPQGVEASAVLWDETIGGGGYVARLLRRGTVARITDCDGDACVQLLAYNAFMPSERLNVADTVKVQWQAYLGPGALLLSDRGRVLMTVVSDTSARHDCLCGCSNRRTADARYGNGAAWGPTPCGRDLLVLGAAKFGLERRDVGANISLFKGVRVQPDGALVLDGSLRPGAFVELRAEMDVLVVLANTPHPLDDRIGYHATTARVTAWRSDRSVDDPLRHATPERERAFLNTDEYVLGVPA
jgi:urea carboxylase-associated protein 2